MGKEKIPAPSRDFFAFGGPENAVAEGDAGPFGVGVVLVDWGECGSHFDEGMAKMLDPRIAVAGCARSGVGASADGENDLLGRRSLLLQP